MTAIEPRTSPNPAYSTAAPSPVAPAFEAMDRIVGGLRVNRWTYRALRAVMRMSPLPQSADVQVDTVDVGGLRMHLAMPAARRSAGALMLLHGGGFVIGGPRDALVQGTALAALAGVPVFCPGYRLAPQHAFPAGLDDGHAAWRALREAAPTFDIDPARLVLGGVSAGGGHAASLAQRLTDEDAAVPAGQLLIYPMLDDRTAATRALDAVKHRTWSNRNNLFGWTSYLGASPGGSPPQYAAAARREDLTGLPPAWIGVGNADLFLDEDRAYAARLSAAGVACTYAEVDGGPHGFDLTQDAPQTRGFYASAAAFLHTVCTAA